MKSKLVRVFSTVWRIVAILVLAVVLLVLGFGFILFGAMFAQQATINANSLAELFGLGGMAVIGLFAFYILRSIWHLARETWKMWKPHVTIQ